MPQDSLSSLTQSIGNAGQLVMTCFDNSGNGNNAVVTFSPAYARIVTPVFAPFQHVNMSVEGGLHIYQYSSNEALTWPIEFANLPSVDGLDDRREQSQGYLSLLSFVRYALNYHASVCQVLSPDGFIETMRYAGGIETFGEADAGQKNTAQRAQRWAGILTFTRVLGL